MEGLVPTATIKMFLFRATVRNNYLNMAFLSSHSFQHSLCKCGLTISAGDQVARDMTEVSVGMGIS